MAYDLRQRIDPGEGASIDVWDDVAFPAGTIVTASLLRVSDGVQVAVPVVTTVADNLRQVHITSTMTSAAAGRTLLLRTVITDPAMPEEPEVLTALLTVGAL